MNMLDIVMRFDKTLSSETWGYGGTFFFFVGRTDKHTVYQVTETI